MLEIEKTSIRLPEDLLEAFQSSVKEEYGKLKGAQKDAFSEAVLLWLAHKKSLPVVMIRDARSGRKHIVLTAQLEENLRDLLIEQRPQLGIIPIGTSRFPVGVISKTTKILLGKFGSPKKVSIQNLDQGETVIERFATRDTHSSKMDALDKWEDGLHSRQDETQDKLELAISWDSPSKMHASLREDYISITMSNQYMPRTM